MKQEVSQPLVIGIVVVVVIAVAIIGWKMFAPSAGGAPAGGGTASADARAQHFKDHPGDKAVFDSMNKGVASPSGATNSSAGHMNSQRR